MKKSSILWKKANTLILNGNSLLSKHPKNYSNNWPTYFSKAKGCYVWTLEGKKMIDISYMGVGTNILGYSNSKINNYVKKIIDKGTMSTLNCPEEVILSNKIIKMHKWADLCKYTRTGGEASTVAVRIGRSYSKKNKVAICGYHGWHDWYLSANLKNKKNLNTHLLPNLETFGVDKNLFGNSIPFNFNDIGSFKKILAKNPDIGVVIMEVARQKKPSISFLKIVRKITKKRKITLIFDECTSGFRETFGGIHLKYKVNPDICILGKALGNGYPINVIFGSKKIMNSARKSFISSTFWSDRVGPAAALKTLEMMQNQRSWRRISKIGISIKKRLNNLFIKNSIKGKVSGLDSLIFFELEGIDNVKLKKIISEEMLKKNFLATNAIYVSVCHTNKIINKYFDELEKVLKKIKIKYLH